MSRCWRDPAGQEPSKTMWPYLNLDQNEDDVLVSAALDLGADILDTYMETARQEQTIIFDIVWTDHTQAPTTPATDIHAVPVGGGTGAPVGLVAGRTAADSETAGVAVAYNGVVPRPEGPLRSYGVSVLMRDGTLVALQQATGEQRYWNDYPEDRLLVAGMRRYLGLPSGDYPEATPLDALAAIVEQAAIHSIERGLALHGDSLYSHLDAVREDPDKMTPMLILVVGVLQEITTFEAQALWRTDWEGATSDALAACDSFLNSAAGAVAPPDRLKKITEWRRFMSWIDDPMLGYHLTEARQVGAGESRAVVERMRTVIANSDDPLTVDTLQRYIGWAEYIDDANQALA